MVTKKKHNLIITLPLIAFSIPLFAEHSITAANGCPYETFMRVDGKCLDISQEGLKDMTTVLSSNSIKKVDHKLEQVSQELTELKAELAEFDDNSVEKVEREIEQVNQGLVDLDRKLAEFNQTTVERVEIKIEDVGAGLNQLSTELAEFCATEHPQADSQSDTLEDICQY